jgi:hypothetical protein
VIPTHAKSLEAGFGDGASASDCPNPLLWGISDGCPYGMGVRHSLIHDTPGASPRWRREIVEAPAVSLSGSYVRELGQAWVPAEAALGTDPKRPRRRGPQRPGPRGVAQSREWDGGVGVSRHSCPISPWTRSHPTGNAAQHGPRFVRSETQNLHRLSLEYAAMRFTAHNIRFPNSECTVPGEPILADIPQAVAIRRTLDIAFAGRVSGKSLVDLGCLEGGWTVEFA